MDIKTAKNYFEDYHKDGIVDKFIDAYPTDELRSEKTTVPFLNFNTSSTFPITSSYTSFFDKHFKDVKGNNLPMEERVPLTHYKQTHMNPVSTEDVFGNNIINHQKDIKVTKKELPEKYAYGLDHKGLGDIAYERLDIETGDSNELSRALENFYENVYLRKEFPGMMEDLDQAKQQLYNYKDPNPKFAEPTSNKIGNKIKEHRKIPVIEKAKGMKNTIEVHAIPDMLGKLPTDETNQNIYDKMYKPLHNEKDRVLTQKEIYKINAILRAKGQKPLPVGTRSKAAAVKIDKIDTGTKVSMGTMDNIEKRMTKLQAHTRGKLSNQKALEEMKTDPNTIRQLGKTQKPEVQAKLISKIKKNTISPDLPKTKEHTEKTKSTDTIKEFLKDNRPTRSFYDKISGKLKERVSNKKNQESLGGGEDEAKGMRTRSKSVSETSLPPSLPPAEPKVEAHPVKPPANVEGSAIADPKSISETTYNYIKDWIQTQKDKGVTEVSGEKLDEMRRELKNNFRGDTVSLSKIEEVLKSKNPNKPIRGTKKGEGVIPKAEAVIETVGSVPLQTLKTALQSLKDEGYTEFTPKNFVEIKDRLGLKKPDESPLKTARTIDEALKILNTNYAPGDNLAISPGGGGPRK